MAKLKTIIVDDERLARAELKRLLEPYTSKIEVIGEFGDPQEAIDQINTLKPDLVFLDIQMPGKTGFDVIEELESFPKVIFVTAYDEYAIRAFEVNALDYLLKPIDEHRLKETMSRIAQQAEEVTEEVQNESILSENDQVFVKDGDRCWFVTLKDVRLFESEGNYIRVLFNNNKPLILKSLNNLDKRLDSKVFFRANRKHIINLKWVEKVESWFNGGLLVELRGGDKIEISRRQAVKLKEMMSL